MRIDISATAKKQHDRYKGFDDYLEQHGIKEEIDAAVEKRVVALQLDRLRKERAISKSELARMIGTSRTQIDRILDPASKNISLVTLNRTARALGKKVVYELVDL
jgi:antitoxin HicB